MRLQWPDKRAAAGFGIIRICFIASEYPLDWGRGCWRGIASEESGEVDGTPGKSNGEYDWKDLFLKIGCNYRDRVPKWMI